MSTPQRRQPNREANRFVPYKQPPNWIEPPISFPLPPLNLQQCYDHSPTSFSPFLESLLDSMSFFTTYGISWIRTFLLEHAPRKIGSSSNISVQHYNQIRWMTHLPILSNASIPPLTFQQLDNLRTSAAQLDNDMRVIGSQVPTSNNVKVETRYLCWIARDAQNWTDWAEDLTTVEYDFLLRVLGDPDFKNNVFPWNECKDKTPHPRNALHAIDVAISCQHARSTPVSIATNVPQNILQNIA